MSVFQNLSEINNVVSRIMGQLSTLHMGITAGHDDDTIVLDDFEIKDSNGVAFTTKMANTVIHNLCSSLEDSRHCGTHFKVIRNQNDFMVVCNGTRGFQVCISTISKELDRMFETVKKCKADIRKMADQFGTETIQHVLKHNMNGIR